MINLKNFRTQIQELDQVFSDKCYQKHLQTELDSLISNIEERIKATTSRENSSLGSSLSSCGLRQTSDKFVSMNKFVSVSNAAPVKKGGSLKDLQKLNEEHKKNMAAVKKPAKQIAKKAEINKAITVKIKSSSNDINDSSDMDNHQIDFVKSVKSEI